MCGWFDLSRWISNDRFRRAIERSAPPTRKAPHEPPEDPDRAGGHRRRRPVAGGAYNYTYLTYTGASSLSPLSSLTTADQAKDLGLLNGAITAVANAINAAQIAQGCLISGGTTVAPTTSAAPTTAASPTTAPPAAEVPEASVTSTGTPACISAIGSVSAQWAVYDVAFRSSAPNVTDTYSAYQRALNEAQATCVGSSIVIAPVKPAPIESGTTTSVTTATIPSATTGVQTGDGSAPSE